MNRRRFLAGCGAAATVGLAGCAASGADGPASVVLTHVELANGTGEPQVFHLLVELHDDVVHWSSHEVDGGDDGEMGGAVVEIAAPDEPGAVEVHGRVGETWRTVDFDADRYDGERVIAVFQYGPWSDDDGTALRGSRLVSDRPTPSGESG